MKGLILSAKNFISLFSNGLQKTGSLRSLFYETEIEIFNRIYRGVRWLHSRKEKQNSPCFLQVLRVYCFMEPGHFLGDFPGYFWVTFGSKKCKSKCSFTEKIYCSIRLEKELRFLWKWFALLKMARHF